MRIQDKRYLLMMSSQALWIVAYLLFDAGDAFAEGDPSPGRKLWDNIMLWVNFGILAFFFMKYARKPLLAYLRNVRNKIEKNLGAINEQVTSAKSVLASESERLKGIDQQLKEIRERILEIGRQEKEKIIESGRSAAERMIENARAYASHRLASAKKAVSDELVDMAISMAEEKLRKAISNEDSDRLFTRFVKDLETSEGLLEKKLG
ncbi:MAG: ATP synthase F0 subunit B [Pseudomonadota bacterium]